MNNKMATVALIVLGLGITVASILADSIGLGDDPGFGNQQTMGVILGAIILGVGVYLYRKGGSE